MIDDINNQKKLEKSTYKNEIKKSIICHDIPYGEDKFKLTLKLYEKLYLNKASIKTIGPISLDVLKLALGKTNRPHDYEDAVWHSEVRAWDLVASTCILKEFGGNIIDLKTGKMINIDTIKDPNAKISFIVSGSITLLNEIYNIYQDIK